MVNIEEVYHLHLSKMTLWFGGSGGFKNSNKNLHSEGKMVPNLTGSRTLKVTANIGPENWCLENYILSFWGPVTFQGRNVSFRVGNILQMVGKKKLPNSIGICPRWRKISLQHRQKFKDYRFCYNVGSPIHVSWVAQAGKVPPESWSRNKGRFLSSLAKTPLKICRNQPLLMKGIIFQAPIFRKKFAVKLPGCISQFCWWPFCWEILTFSEVGKVTFLLFKKKQTTPSFP